VVVGLSAAGGICAAWWLVRVVVFQAGVKVGEVHGVSVFGASRSWDGLRCWRWELVLLFMAFGMEAWSAGVH
jgi:hypothetical protein